MMTASADSVRHPGAPPSSQRLLTPPSSSRYGLLQQRLRAVRGAPGLAAPSVDPEAVTLTVGPASSPFAAAYAASPAAAPVAITEGHHLAGRYQLLERLGEGGMGIVWRARSLALDMEVAVKLIHPGARIPNARERLLREARAAARVIHPGAARVLDFGMAEGGIPFLVMELLRGRSLAAELHAAGPLDPIAAVRLLLPVIGALDAAHREGIVHRDVKPGNVFLAEERGRVVPKLIDFGIAALAPSPWASKLASYPPLYGSPRYLAPEQAEGSRVADPRADVWGASLVLYEAITGAPAYGARQDPASGRLGRPAVLANEPELWAVLARGLELNPAARWPSAWVLGAALARWALARGVAADCAGGALEDLWLQR